MIPFGQAIQIVTLSLAAFYVTKWIIQDFLGIKTLCQTHMKVEICV